MLLSVLATPLLWWMAGLGWGVFAFGWIAFTPLFFALHDLAPRQRWRLGYLTGWLGFALINWWIVPTIARGGPVIGLPVAASAVLGVVAVALIALIHGAGVALIALLWNTRHPLPHRFSWLLPILVALAWAAFDWARSLGPLAHMWGAPAYTQWRDTAFLQNAAWLGQHGLSALCVWFAASLALWMARSDGASHPVLWRAPVLVFLALHLWGAWQLNQSEPSTQAIRVLLVQTYIPALRKNQGGGETPLQQAARLTREHFQKPEYSAPVDLVVWPESVLNFRRFGTERTPMGLEWSAVAALSRELNTPILFGGLSRVSTSAGEELMNEATLVAPDGSHSHSAKVRLVPFGERAVGAELWPWLHRFAPDPPITRATGAKTLSLKTTKSTLSIGSAICFESCFPAPSTQLKRAGAQALFVLTNDAWFDGTEAPWQHAAMSAVRAVENRLPVAQASNGGYAVAVDAKGRFTALSEYNKPQAIAVELRIK